MSACLLSPARDDARHVCDMYGLTDSDWRQLVNDEWRNVCAVTRVEYVASGSLPQSFHLLPYFRAHALYAPSASRRQAANYARADILEPYMCDDDD